MNDPRPKFDSEDEAYRYAEKHLKEIGKLGTKDAQDYYEIFEQDDGTYRVSTEVPA